MCQVRVSPNFGEAGDEQRGWVPRDWLTEPLPRMATSQAAAAEPVQSGAAAARRLIRDLEHARQATETES